jgi:hypothetical protein
MTCAIGQEIDLSNYEKQHYSQQGEDGVIQKILEVIGDDSKYYVEFGAMDGHYLSNTKYLRDYCNWKGLLLDSGHEDPSINLHRAHVTASNINELFAQYEVPYNLDVLSIDIDSNDFYVWKAIDNKYRPRLVVIEYNASHLPNEDKVVMHNPNHYWDGTNYYGASILAMYHLGRSKGYSLVYAENRGVNLFFVRDDLIKAPFKNMNNVEKIFRAACYSHGPRGGHPQDPQNRPYTTSTALLNPDNKQK